MGRSTYTVNINEVKIYRRSVHVLRSFNDFLRGGIPKNTHVIRRQVNGALTMMYNLLSKNDNSLGDFRIKVTVKGPTLQAAVKLVDKTSFLDPLTGFG
jgi:hypothetical protein